FRTSRAVHHKKAVNGQGAVNSAVGARYNYPGVESVYVTEDVPTCLAEKMFYFQREVLTQLDKLHLFGGTPPALEQRYCLWEIFFRHEVVDIFDLSAGTASAMNVFPSLMLNPSQDYEHLKHRRAQIQSS